MKILVACEFSGIVRDAFAAKGHDAWSCDFLPSERPGQHIQGDAIEAIHSQPWDMLIAHPPCTFLTVTANKWHLPKYKDRFPNRDQDRLAAIDFFMRIALSPINRIAIENPIGVMSSKWRRPDCIVQPWQFGDNARKATCFWLKGLPPLLPIARMSERLDIHVCKSGNTMSKWHVNLGSSRERAHLRSKTFPGIAVAMANQWGTP